MFFVTNPSEKYARQNWMISPGKGENKKCLSCHRLVLIFLIRVKDGTKEKSIRESVTFCEKIRERLPTSSSANRKHLLQSFAQSI